MQQKSCICSVTSCNHRTQTYIMVKFDNTEPLQLAGTKLPIYEAKSCQTTKNGNNHDFRW